MIIETVKLEGPTLDWAVAKATGSPSELATKLVMDGYSPSADWSQGGPLIEEYVTALNQSSYGGWWAHSGSHVGEAIMPLVAAMRAVVAAELDSTVDVPEELVPTIQDENANIEN